MAQLRWRENGPIVVDVPAGTVYVHNGQAITLERAKLALCRCGQSTNKPLCDGTHKDINFCTQAGHLYYNLEQQDG